MLFNSFDFAIFFPIVFFLYWFLFKKNIQLRNIFLIAASYTFYGWWDWRFLSLIIISSFIDFYVGRKLDAEEARVQASEAQVATKSANDCSCATSLGAGAPSPEPPPQAAINMLPAINNVTNNKKLFLEIILLSSSGIIYKFVK